MRTGRIGGNGTDDPSRFTLEDGKQLRRSAQEEIHLFGPGVPYAEWVDE